jgi:alpha-ketoglutarate-dependent taurine dioxygenase
MSPKLLVEQQGYAFVPSFCPELEPTAAAVALGVPEQVAGLGLVQELLPKTPDLTTPNTYSGNFGLDAFPLHTDLAHWARPPRYLMLRCAHGDPDAQTQIVDGRSVVATLGAKVLARCLARARRPMNGTFQLLPIWQEFSDQGQQRIRWDSIYLRPANEYAQTIFRRIEECLSRVQPVAEVLLNKGDTLLLDNWRLLHGRSPVRDRRSSRKIHRIYLSSLT